MNFRVQVFDGNVVLLLEVVLETDFGLVLLLKLVDDSLFEINFFNFIGVFAGLAVGSNDRHSLHLLINAFVVVSFVFKFVQVVNDLVFPANF